MGNESKVGFDGAGEHRPHPSVFMLIIKDTISLTVASFTIM